MQFPNKKSTTTAVNAATHQLRAQKEDNPTLHSQTTQRILSSPYYRYGGNDATNNGSKCSPPPNNLPTKPIEVRKVRMSYDRLIFLHTNRVYHRVYRHFTAME